MDDNTKTLTANECASVLRVSRRTLYTWGTQSYGPQRFVIGSRIRYRATEVEDFINAEYAAASGEPDGVVPQ
jgi:predicted DNA-binding transcriptional regulator AlpA